MAEQSEELAGVREALARARGNLEKARERQKEWAEITTLKAELERGAEEAKMMADGIAELKGEVAVFRRELQTLQAARRTKVRKDWVGQTIDLSATQGEGYEEVRVFEVIPTGIKILLPTGTETVPLAGLPEDIRELFLMSEAEATAYREQLENSAKARADRYALAWEKKRRRLPMGTPGPWRLSPCFARN